MGATDRPRYGSLGIHKGEPSKTMAQETIDTNCMTLTRFILAEQKKYAPTGTGDLTQLLASLQSACKAVSAAVRRAGISNLFGAAGDTNVQVRRILMITMTTIMTKLTRM